ncbi:TIGR04219 family outer membrane beta-barrel protein [Sulfurimonas sp. SAG-AH-194-C21]|nr:TIGR04219 family outer membrane beta-barrel protein [Sulfurimonas sp. SAG-AH-194-C21]MDF1883003.1 TIGR04219 family outer membrane beta-barrel protein [Sulfurimonas sp. SAG-AH-194-C21]
MKKILTTLTCAAILATTVSADFGRVEMGGGAWNQIPTGILSYTDAGSTGTYTSNEKEEQSMYAWMLIKHPIPIIPNLRLEYTTLKDNGVVSGSFKDFDVPGATTTGSLDITQYDVIPYYNLLDNTAWITLDLGLNLKVMETTYKVDGVNVPGIGGITAYEDTSSIIIPMGYVRARVEIPVTNIGIEADVKYISYAGNTVSDIRVKVDYTLAFIPVIQPGLEIGYRVQKFDLTSEDEKTKFNIDFSGVYAGLMIRF